MKKSASDKKAPTARKPRQKKLTREQVKSLFDDQLRRQYWAEKELGLMLPKILSRTTSYELATAIRYYIDTSEQQILRLIRTFDSIEERVAGTKDHQVYDLLTVLELIQANDDFGYATDANILIGCREISQRGIEGFSASKSHAETLGEEQAAEILNSAVKAEQEANSQLAEVRLPSIYFDQAG